VTALLDARGLTVVRGKTTAVSRVDLAIHAGEALALVGPNAAGKSTLVRALAGVLPWTEGGVWLLGRNVSEWRRETLAREIALVSSEVEGPSTLTVADRVAFGRYPHRGPFRPMRDNDRAAVRQALRQTGIEALARRSLGTLSTGERQLATLARGLAQEPKVLLLDEPSAHLDIGHQLRLFRVLEDARRAGVAVLAVVHDLQRAAAWASRMVLLAGGRVAAEGMPDAVLAGPEAASAFGVRIKRHGVAGTGQPLYSFEEFE